MTLLNGRLERHGVDVEKLAHRAVSAYLTARRAHLQPADRDDLVTYVVAELWRISVKFDPDRSAVSFSTHAYRLAGARCVDWYRLRFGRTRWQFGDGTVHARERPVPLSLDRVAADGHRLVDSLADRAGDGEEDRSTVIAGLEDRGDGSRDRDHALLRAAATRGARGRAA